MLLKDKTILISGSSKGIGKGIAVLFAQEGANLVLLARNKSALEELSVFLSQTYHIAVSVYEADVRSQDSLKAVFNDLNAKNIYIDVLVNNAGIMTGATLQTVKDELIKETYETNVFGPIYLSQLALRSFLRKRKGSIINLSSIIGVNGSAGHTVYGSSKMAIIGFTKSLSKELAPLNIRVNAIAPGFIDTYMTKDLSPAIYEKTLASVGMRRIGTVEDVAKVALFLASDLSEYVTGQVIGVDGGMLI
jgi:3-oxoacyl-[acyl-carrier protein] reductase